MKVGALRIMLATSQFEVERGGGAARSARVIAEGLVRRGHSVCVVTTARRSEACVEVSDGLVIHRVRPYNLYWVGAKDDHAKVLRVPWQIMDVWNPMIHRRVRAIVDEFLPDVVHANKIRGLSPAVWTAAATRGVPIVQTCRDYELMSPEGTLVGRLGEMARTRSPLLWPYQAVRRRLSGLVAAATAPSAYTLRQLREVDFFPRAVTRVIPNTHGLTNAALATLVAREPPPSTSPLLRLVFQGRVEALKGIEPLCVIVERLATEGVGIHLTVIGPGSRLDQLTQRFRGCSAIEFAGPLYGDAKHARIASADLCVAPSTGTEVFGNVVVEGYAAGRPALVSSAGGLPELVTADQDLLVFPSGDWSELERRIRVLAGRVGWVRGLRMRSFEWARLYAEDAVLGEYERVFRDVLQMRTTSRRS